MIEIQCTVSYTNFFELSNTLLLMLTKLPHTLILKKLCVEEITQTLLSITFALNNFFHSLYSYSSSLSTSFIILILFLFHLPIPNLFSFYSYFQNLNKTMGNHSSIPSRFSFSVRPTRRRTVAYPFPILHDDTPSTLSKQQSDAVSLGYYLKPSGLYPTCTWDNRHVARLITRGQLVPRYPGKDEPCEQAREECPICMLVYPMLNTTKCCSARLCTECYLQIRPPRHNRQPCPFCKKKKVHAGFKGTRSISEMDREEKDHIRAVQAMKKEVLQQESQMIGKQTQEIINLDKKEEIEEEQPITIEGCKINILGATDVERDEYEANDEILSNRKISSSWLRKEDVNEEDDNDNNDEDNGMFIKTEQVEIIESDSTYGSLASSSSSSCQQMSGILTINVEPEEDLERKKKDEVKNASFRGRRSLTGRKHAIHITTSSNTTTITGKGNNGNRGNGECDRQEVGRTSFTNIVFHEDKSLQEAIRRSLYDK